MEFIDIIEEKLEKIEKEESINICNAAKLVYNSIRSGGTFYILGTGHSHMIAEEFYIRAGGLATVKPILQDELMLHRHPLKSTMIERLDSYADILCGLYNFTDKDTILIVSNSGRNKLPVEMCLRAKKIGMKVITISSLKGMASQKSRHECGLKTNDLADVNIDNEGDEGDTTMYLSPNIKMGSTSTITGAFIAQKLGMEIAKLYLADGIEPDVFRSSNVDHSDEINQGYYDEIIKNAY